MGDFACRSVCSVMSCFPCGSVNLFCLTRINGTETRGEEVSPRSCHKRFFFFRLHFCPFDTYALSFVIWSPLWGDPLWYPFIAAFTVCLFSRSFSLYISLFGSKCSIYPGLTPSGRLLANGRTEKSCKAMGIVHHRELRQPEAQSRQNLLLNIQDLVFFRDWEERNPT